MFFTQLDSRPKEGSRKYGDKFCMSEGANFEEDVKEQIILASAEEVKAAEFRQALIEYFYFFTPFLP